MLTAAFWITLVVGFVMTIVFLTCLTCGWVFTGRARLSPKSCRKKSNKNRCWFYYKDSPEE